MITKKIKELFNWDNLDIDHNDGNLYINCFFNDIYTDIAFNPLVNDYTLVWYNEREMIGNTTVKNEELIKTLKQIYES